MGSGIGDTNSLAYWNSPAHWIQSDLQTAISRGEMDKAKALNQNLATIGGIEESKIKADTAVESAKIGIQPQMEAINVLSKPNPVGTDLLKENELLKKKTVDAENSKALWEKFMMGRIK